MKDSFCGMLRLSAFFFLIFLISWSCKPAEVEPPVRNKWVIKTKPLTKLGGYKAASGGTIEIRGSDSIASKGVCWSRNGFLPTVNSGNDFVTDDGNSPRDWSSTITGLRPNDSILIRAYVLTKNDGVVYGDTLSQKYVVQIESTLPTVVTNLVPDPRKSSALLSGSIYTDGGSNIVEQGFWIYNHTTQGPVQMVKVPVKPNEANFDTLLRGLSINTTYEVKAYARNAAYPNQNQIQYGQSMFFFTPESKNDAFPEVETKDSTLIKTPADTAAKVRGKIIRKGDPGSQIISKGVCFGTSPNPTINNNKVIASGSSDLFEVKLDDLVPGTTYYYRAFAQNAVALSYGEEKSLMIIP